MFYDGRTLLNIVDTVTRFSALTFLDGDEKTYGQIIDGV